MSRAILPEDDRPDYDDAPTQYEITVEGVGSTTTTDADLAQAYSEAGARVTARKGWDA